MPGARPLPTGAPAASFDSSPVAGHTRFHADHIGAI